MESRAVYGGQAVLEGVMIRGRRHVGTAVRLPDGSITARCRSFESLTDRVRPLGWPILRGPIHLWESLSLGLAEMFFSLEQVGGGDEKLSPAETFGTVAVSLTIAIGLFFVLPTVGASWVAGYVGRSIGPNLLEGGLRLTVLVLYILTISRMQDVRSFLAYHGAEHRVINGWEAGAPLSVDGVARFSIVHRRCGTSFLFLVAVVSILVFSLFGWPGLWQRLALRIVTIPLVAALAFEIIRLAGRGWPPAVILAAPGMALQRLTTRQPDSSRVEVALAALNAVREFEQRQDVHVT